MTQFFIYIQFIYESILSVIYHTGTYLPSLIWKRFNTVNLFALLCFLPRKYGIKYQNTV